MPTGIYQHRKGFKHSKETKRKIGESHKGKKHSEKTKEKMRKAHPSIWKGDKASYSAIHMWVERYKGKQKFCEMCGTIIAKKFEWANIDHKYRRVLDDYIRLCTSCHMKFDKEKR